MNGVAGGRTRFGEPKSLEGFCPHPHPRSKGNHMPRPQRTATFKTGADRVTRSQRTRASKKKRQGRAWAAMAGDVVTYQAGDERPAYPLPPAATKSQALHLRTT